MHRSQLRLATDEENNLKLDAPLPNRPPIVTFRRAKADGKDDDVVLPMIPQFEKPFQEETSMPKELKQEPKEQGSAATKTGVIDAESRPDPPCVETVEDDDVAPTHQDSCDDPIEMFASHGNKSEKYRSPMDEPTLKDMNEPTDVDDQEDLAPQQRDRRPGDPCDPDIEGKLRYS